MGITMQRRSADSGTPRSTHSARSQSPNKQQRNDGREEPPRPQPQRRGECTTTGPPSCIAQERNNPTPLRYRRGSSLPAAFVRTRSRNSARRSLALGPGTRIKLRAALSSCQALRNLDSDLSSSSSAAFRARPLAPVLRLYCTGSSTALPAIASLDRLKLMGSTACGCLGPQAPMQGCGGDESRAVTVT